MQNGLSRSGELSAADRSELLESDASWSRVETFHSPLLKAHRLSEGVLPLELWCCTTEDISKAALADVQHGGLLSLAEQRRWHNFRLEKDRRLFLATRLLVRSVLSQYADLHPAQWRFTKNAFGRPAIAPEIAARIKAETGCAPVNFNLSRSGSLVVCAIARSGDIGVDVEDERRSFDPWEIAPAVLAPLEMTELTRVAEHERSTMFLRYWVLKEAFVKACGRGLTLDVNCIQFTGVMSPQPKLEFTAVFGRTTEHWSFELLHLFDRYRVAVAYRPITDA